MFTGASTTKHQLHCLDHRHRLQHNDGHVRNFAKELHCAYLSSQHNWKSESLSMNGL